MKKSWILLPALAATAGALALYFTTGGTPHYHLPQGFTVTAHAGALGTEDNSVASLQTGIANADIIEFDLQFLSDGTPVLSHDHPAPKSAVTLREAFSILKNSPQTKANVDIKSTENLPAIEPLAREYGVFDQIFLTGVGEDFLDAVRRDCPAIPYYLNMSPKKGCADPAYIRSVVDTVRAAGAVGINCHLDDMTPALSKAMHDAGLLVSLWTANCDQQIAKALRCSPDNLTSRIPDRVRAVVERSASIGA